MQRGIVGQKQGTCGCNNSLSPHAAPGGGGKHPAFEVAPGPPERPDATNQFQRDHTVSFETWHAAPDAYVCHFGSSLTVSERPRRVADQKNPAHQPWGAEPPQIQELVNSIRCRCTAATNRDGVDLVGVLLSASLDSHSTSTSIPQRQK